MNTPLIGFIIVIALIVGSALSIMNKSLQERPSRVVRSYLDRAAPRKKSAACLDDRDVDLLGGRVQR
jgi:hypothetical protein